MSDRESTAPARGTAAQIGGLVAWLAVTFVAAFIGSRFETGPWYRALEKPSFNPPSWVFAPVWTTLYVMMAVAAWRVWRRWGFAARAAVTVYLVQLALNTAWSWLFFGRQDIGAALVDIMLLLIAIVVTLALFWRRDRLAGALLLPYLCWVAFASVLNFSIWRLNG